MRAAPDVTRRPDQRSALAPAVLVRNHLPLDHFNS